MRYEPWDIPTNTSRKNKIRLLMQEFVSIQQSGFMRMVAQDRECFRIYSQLKKLGVTLLEDDNGDPIGIEDHNSDCQLKKDIDNGCGPGEGEKETTAECNCPIIYRVDADKQKTEE
jgi:CRISPR/Cas system-associated endoribonuclease Cas2